MNKIFIVLLVFFIFSTSVIGQYNLIDITPKSDVISPGEVYQVELSLKNPITELKKQNIKLYSSLQISQPISPSILELEKNNYFIYFEVPKSIPEGEYTLKIEGQSFLVNNILIKEDGFKNVTLKQSEPAVSLIPGAIQLLKDKTGNFVITAVSHDVNTEINFNVPSYITHTYVVQQYLNKNSPRQFIFEYNTANAPPSEISFLYGGKTFVIPVIIKDYEPVSSLENQSQNNISVAGNSIFFFVDGDKLSKTIDSAETIEGNLKMANLLDKPLLNLQLSLERDLGEIMSVTPLSIEKVESLSNFTVFMSINSNKNPLKDVYSGKLIVSNQEISETLDIEIKINQKYSEIKIPDNTEKIDEDGNFEAPEDKPDVVEQIIPWNISGGYEEESKVASKPIVTLITILLIVAVVGLLLSQKKTTKKKTFKELMEESKR